MVINMKNIELTINNNTYNVSMVLKNNKYTYLRVDPQGGILVTTPKLMSNKALEKFILRNIEKIDKQINKNLERNQARIQSVILLGKEFPIVFEEGNKCTVESSHVIIKGRSLEDKYKLVDKFYLKQAKKVLPNIFEEVFADLNLKIALPTLQIRKMKTRWGVCHTKGYKVVLNSELIRYKPYIIRYVIIHELMHFFEPNHSSKFWDLVSKYEPNFKQIRKEMNK